MAEKFNVKKEINKLQEIYSSTKPTKEQFKKAVVDNLPKADNPDTRDFMSHLGVEKLDTPEAGLKAKLNYWKNKDNSVQERIVYAQSWNLAVSFVGSLAQKDSFRADQSVDKYELEFEFWQKYFYQQLKNQNGNN